MADDRNSTDKGSFDKPQSKPRDAQSSSDDLDARPEDIDKVKGGRRVTGDPCEGGQAK